MGFAATLPLLHSLGWLTALMFAAVWPSVPGGVGRKHAGWLIAFCATRLLAAAQTLGAGAGPETRLLAAVLSGTLLWEFARRVWNDRGAPRISAATHLLAAEIVALVFAVSPDRPEWFLPIDALHTVLPGLLGSGAAWLLAQETGADADSPRVAGERIALVGLGLFAIPGGILTAGWDALPPWIATLGFGLACFTLPATRTPAVYACAAGMALVALIGPAAVTARQRDPRDAVAADLNGRVARAAAPLQGKFAARLAGDRVDPSTRETLRQYLEGLANSDPLVHSAKLWRARDERFRALDLATGEWREAHGARLGTDHGAGLDRSFFVPADAAHGRPFVSAWAPLIPGAFESPTAWLALEFPEVFWTVQREHARRTGIALVGALAAFSAMGFVLVVRQRLEAAQQLALERTRAADRAKTEFLAFLGHELRTPLQTILGRAELLRENPAAARHAAAIETQGALLLRLVNDLLDLGTIEAGQFRLRPQPFSLRQALAAVEDAVRPPAAAKGLSLSVTIDAAVPDPLLGDEARLRQILGNLLGNAVKYTPRGEVALRVSLDPERAPSAAAWPLLFLVRDTGPGLPPEKISQLFTLFSRLDAGDTFRREGTGVGLALVRRLCALMGGTVTAGNRAEGGAEFAVRLDFSPREDAAAPAPTVPLAREGIAVLLAEDNTAARELLGEALGSLGHRVEAVADGPAALAAATARAFATIVLDINLPGLDGVALARELRARHVTARLVACSAEALPEVREAALAAGCDAFLVKPVSLATLARALTPAGEPAAPDLFAQLHTPTATARTRALLVDEWPRLRGETEAAVAAGDGAALRRLAHYLQSSALLLADATLLGLCRRLSSFSAADGADNPRAPLDEIEHHFATWPASPASPSSATTPRT